MNRAILLAEEVAGQKTGPLSVRGAVLAFPISHRMAVPPAQKHFASVPQRESTLQGSPCFRLERKFCQFTDGVYGRNLSRDSGENFRQHAITMHMPDQETPGLNLPCLPG